MSQMLQHQLKMSSFIQLTIYFSLFFSLSFSPFPSPPPCPPPSPASYLLLSLFIFFFFFFSFISLVPNYLQAGFEPESDTKEPWAANCSLGVVFAEISPQTTQIWAKTCCFHPYNPPTGRIFSKTFVAG